MSLISPYMERCEAVLLPLLPGALNLPGRAQNLVMILVLLSSAHRSCFFPAAAVYVYVCIKKKINSVKTHQETFCQLSV